MTTPIGNSLNSRSDVVSAVNSDDDDLYYVSKNEVNDNPIITKDLIGRVNFVSWKKSMEIALSARLKLSFLQGKYPKLDDRKARAKWQRCNDVIMSWLISSVSEEIIGQILHAKDVMIAWNILHARFSGTNLARKSGLMKEANNLVVSKHRRSIKRTSLLRRLRLDTLLPSPRIGESDIKRKLEIAFGVTGGTALIMFAIFVIYLRRRKTNCYTRNMSSDPSSNADPEKLYSLYGVKMFTYEELEKATDNFNESRKIGGGGFGTVYLGKLEDGRTVAVKRLYENNHKRVEQFLNEVEILARLHHQNLVMLYGCTSRHSHELLLVYEYISNGTVADHLHGEKAKPGSLSWQTRLKIAVETASALKYLHASDIIHRDVKTNNILLEDNFSVKVADFGISRLFPLDVTHVSTAPQGTPGYFDPEYFQCFQLTDKSDVYSFGVVLAELISSKPAVDLTRHHHEMSLSNMAINKIQNDALEEFVDPSLGFDRDCNVRKSITAVAKLAFQCLQSHKDMRPSMQEVLQILMQIQCGKYQTEDNAEELEI